MNPKIRPILIFLLVLLLLTIGCSSVDEPRSTEPPVAKTTAAFDLTSDNSNCGAVGYACLNGRTCLNSVCSPAWQAINTRDAPTPRTRAAATEYNGKYVISGGCENGAAVPSRGVGVYDPTTNTWNGLADMDFPRAGHVMFSTTAGLFAGSGTDDCTTVTVGDTPFAKYVITSWMSIPINNYAGQGQVAVYLGGNQVVYFGGIVNGFPSPFGQYGNVEDANDWHSFDCRTDIFGCERMDAFVMFTEGNSLRVLGGDGGYTAPAGTSFDLTSHTWSNWTPTRMAPDFTAFQVSSSIQASLPTRGADSGTRVFYVSPYGSVLIYEKDRQSWYFDQSSLPVPGYCGEGPVAYVNGELISYSGNCNNAGTFSTVGARYQPPAPGITPPLIDYAGPNLITVPGGTFPLGDETNIRPVTFNTFSIDETEVTVDDYAECVNENVCSEPATGDPCNWGIEGRGNYPVNCVDLGQARDYCTWANKRLPTQEEWEYAGRYDDGRKYAWGTSTSGYATKTNTNSGDPYTYTSPVGTFSPDGDTLLGLKDMSGNVWEWTQSVACFNETGPCTNCPEGETCTNACDMCGVTDGVTDPVIKGGGYSHPLASSRLASRTYGSAETGAGTPFLGFRCALTGAP